MPNGNRKEINALQTANNTLIQSASSTIHPVLITLIEHLASSLTNLTTAQKTAKFLTRLRILSKDVQAYIYNHPQFTLYEQNTLLKSFETRYQTTTGLVLAEEPALTSMLLSLAPHQRAILNWFLYLFGSDSKAFIEKFSAIWPEQAEKNSAVLPSEEIFYYSVGYTAFGSAYWLWVEAAKPYSDIDIRGATPIRREKEVEKQKERCLKESIHFLRQKQKHPFLPDVRKQYSLQNVFFFHTENKKAILKKQKTLLDTKSFADLALHWSCSIVNSADSEDHHSFTGIDLLYKYLGCIQTLDNLLIVLDTLRKMIGYSKTSQADLDNPKSLLIQFFEKVFSCLPSFAQEMKDVALIVAAMPEGVKITKPKVCYPLVKNRSDLAILIRYTTPNTWISTLKTHNHLFKKKENLEEFLASLLSEKISDSEEEAFSLLIKEVTENYPKYLEPPPLLTRISNTFLCFSSCQGRSTQPMEEENDQQKLLENT